MAVINQKIHRYALCIDETIDSVRLNVSYVNIGIKQPKDIGKTYLIHTEYLYKVNHSTTFQLFYKSMHIFGQIMFIMRTFYKFVLNATPYMKKAGRYTQALYPKVLHVTCLAHAFYNVC